MITPEQHAEIRRLYFGEHWTVGTIAAALGLHHDAVQAAIAHDTGTVRRGTCRPTALDPYLPFMGDTLAQYPRLRGTPCTRWCAIAGIRARWSNCGVFLHRFRLARPLTTIS